VAALPSGQAFAPLASGQSISAKRIQIASPGKDSINPMADHEVEAVAVDNEGDSAIDSIRRSTTHNRQNDESQHDYDRRNAFHNRAK